MVRKTSRRFANYSQQNQDQKFNGESTLQGQSLQQQTGYGDTEKDNDSRIADMAQGFFQAQAKISDQGSAINNLEIALLLQKCNNQLEEIKRSTQGNSNGNSPSNQNDLQTPMKKISEQNQKQNTGRESSTMQKNNSNTNSEEQQNMTAVQNVSQVLAQAQYELANELENSLKKLKQVIAESEKIANNISNLLGEEGKTKS